MINVPHETMEKLKLYVDLLLKWNSQINLIADQRPEIVWERHIWDSAQLIPLIPNLNTEVLDIGAGAGLPGIVLAILGVKKVILVDSDKRKCIFLSEVKRYLALDIEIINARIEEIFALKIEWIVSRGLASLSRLFSYVKHVEYSGMLMMKGEKWYQEVQEAQKDWCFNYVDYVSQTNPQSRIIYVSNVCPKQE